MREWSVRRLVAAHTLNAVAEWAVGVALLVHAFAWGGAQAVGIVSVALLLPALVCPPLVGLSMTRWRPFAIRVTALAVQVVAYGGAAAAAIADAGTPVVAPFAIAGLAATTALHPTGAAILPRAAPTTESLVGAQLGIGYSDSASARWSARYWAASSLRSVDPG